MVNYKKQIFSLIFGQLLSLILGMVLPLLLVRQLTLEDYGNYAKIVLLINTISSIFAFGVSSELYYFFPREKGENRSIFVFQSYIILVILAFLSVVFLNIPLTRDLLLTDKFLSDNSAIISLCILFSIPEKLIHVLYLLNHNYKLSRVYSPIFTILKVFLILILYYVYNSVYSILISILIINFLQFIITTFYAFKIIQKYSDKILNYKKKLFSEQISYLLPFGIASSIRLLSESIDKIIVLSFVSSPVYAIYSIAFYGIPGLPQIYLSISQGYLPRMSEAYSNNNTKDVISLYHSMVSKTLSYTIPLVLIVIYFADIIIPTVFSEKYIESINYFRIYLLTFIVTAFGFGNIIRATGDTKKSLRVNIISICITIPITYILIKNLYLNGAIISAVLNIIIPKMLLIYYDSKSINTPINRLIPLNNIYKILICSIISFIPIYLLDNLGIDNIIFKIFLGVVYLIFVISLEILLNVFLISKDEIKNKIKCVIK